MTSGPAGHDDSQLGGPGRRRLLQREVRAPGVVIDEGAESYLPAANLSGPTTNSGIGLEELIKKTPEQLVVGEMLGRG